MENNVGKLMDYYPQQAPAQGLLPKIVNLIREKRKQGLQMRLYIFSAFSLASIPLLAWALISTSRAIASSNLFQYLSLVVSDTSMVATYWDNFLMLVMETIPALGLAMSLGALVFCLWSLRSLWCNYYYFNKLAKQ